MRKAILFAFALWLLCAGRAFAVSSDKLIAEASLFDGSTVSYQGEVIGPVLKRADHVWVSVYDGQNALSVWLPADLAKDITQSGGYRRHGDEISVIGTFFRSCPQHGGGLDIHGTYVMVRRAGQAVPEYIASYKLFTLAGLLGVLICLLITRAFWMKRKKT